MTWTAWFALIAPEQQKFHHDVSTRFFFASDFLGARTARAFVGIYIGENQIF